MAFIAGAGGDTTSLTIKTTTISRRPYVPVVHPSVLSFQEDRVGYKITMKDVNTFRKIGYRRGTVSSFLLSSHRRDTDPTNNERSFTATENYHNNHDNHYFNTIVDADDDNQGDLCDTPAQEEEELSETQQLMARVKDAGTAGIISYAFWELAFWCLSIPACVVGYKSVTGHWPDLSNVEDQKQLGAEGTIYNVRKTNKDRNKIYFWKETKQKLITLTLSRSNL